MFGDGDKLVFGVTEIPPRLPTIPLNEARVRVTPLFFVFFFVLFCFVVVFVVGEEG